MHRLALLVIGLAGLLPATASAERLADGGDLAGGPRITAGGVAWLEQTDDGWAVRATRDGSRFTAATGKLEDEEYDSDDLSGDYSSEALGSAFAAAGEVAAVETTSRGGNSKYRQYVDTSTVSRVSLTPGATPVHLTGCSAYADEFGGPAPTNVPVGAASATDGVAVAVSQCGVAKVFEASSGSVLAEFPAPRPTRGLALAGRFVAYPDGEAIVVRDWRAAAEVYRAPVGAPAGLAFDLQDDGALAVVTFAETPGCGGGGALTWHSPASPAGTPVPVAPCAAVVAADDGRAVVVAQTGDGQVLAEAGPGAPRRDVAWLGRGAGRTGGIDAVGGTTVYAMRRCAGGTTVHRASGDASPAAVECPRLRLATVVRRGGVLRVRGRLHPSATGRLSVTYRLRGRSARRSLRAAAGRYAVSVRLPRRLQRGGGGRVTVRYGGDAVFRPMTVRDAL